MSGRFQFFQSVQLPYVESDVGRVHPRPKTTAKRHLLAIDNSDLAGRSGNRFRAPLTMLAKNPICTHVPARDFERNACFRQKPSVFTVHIYM